MKTWIVRINNSAWKVGYVFLHQHFQSHSYAHCSSMFRPWFTRGINTLYNLCFKICSTVVLYQCQTFTIKKCDCSILASIVDEGELTDSTECLSNITFKRHVNVKKKL